MTEAAPEAVSYTITPAEPGAHLYQVTVTVADPDSAGQVFSMPAWIPGSYMIRDYARHIVSIEAEAVGRPVALEKVDKTTWRAAPCREPLTVTTLVYAWDLSVRGAHLDNTHAYFNGPCVFLAAEGREHRPVRLEVRPPPDGTGANWRLATAMRRVSGEEWGYGTFAAHDYDELIDHPFEIGDLTIGEFGVNGIPHAIAVRGARRFDLERLCRDMERTCAEHHRLLGAPEDLDRYVFLLYCMSDGYGGLEHRWSSSLVCKRSDLPRAGEERVSEGYRRFLGLVSHEYFHLWNVKRMKPAAFTPYDLTAESHTGLLWVFEGITSYYDDLALVRSGLIDSAGYLELLGQTITKVLRTPGRRLQSIEESSFDAWTKLYKQDENGPNSIISYYSKGALVALALDLKLRGETGGCNLDVVMRECWRRYGETGAGMPERALESVAEELSGLDLGDFFERYVRGTVDPPLDELLAAMGVGYHLRKATGAGDAGGKPSQNNHQPLPWLGGRMSSEGERTRLAVVLADGPLQRAGAAAGDELVALDGLRATPSSMPVLLRGYRAGDTAELTVFRQDELLTLPITLAEAPADTCYLTLDEEADGDVLARRQDWLGR